MLNIFFVILRSTAQAAYRMSFSGVLLFSSTQLRLTIIAERIPENKKPTKFRARTCENVE